ncbi:hypothetical protein [Ochrobactrum sp. BTU1]|uniref:hypothetical protein n=1 Tax=Ochrobactrum sp. BTU1 TaxID=2840456 RepID=UPI001C04FE64|nr:hypothetical protein KMS41_11820 [Ochrobactrum sp. BTU1]
MLQGDHNILILAHPGHELRIHHWLEINTPTVYLLTDGSGGQMASRVHFSKDLIDRCGASSGAVFGEISDKDWYASIMAGKNDLLAKTIQTIVDDAPKNCRVQIVADALDGYNPMHDMAWFIGKIVHHRIAQHATALPFLASAATTNVQGSVELSLQLNAEARARKTMSVKSYTPLAEEARRILEQDPLAFDEERLISQSFDWKAEYKPLWEKIGRQRVNDGIYSDCLTFQQHVRPLLKDLVPDE